MRVCGVAVQAAPQIHHNLLTSGLVLGLQLAHPSVEAGQGQQGAGDEATHHDDDGEGHFSSLAPVPSEMRTRFKTSIEASWEVKQSHDLVSPK